MATIIHTPAFATRIDLPEIDRDVIVDLLNARLADTADLYSQIKQAHWNVKGPNFFQLHELYDKLAAGIFPFIDMIAERATALGGFAKGTARMAAANSTLPELPDITDGHKLTAALIGRFAHYVAAIRKAIDLADERHDKASADLFTEIAREADKQLWFLEAHVQG